MSKIKSLLTWGGGNTNGLNITQKYFINYGSFFLKTVS